MEPKESRLLVWGAVVVLANFAAVLWHLLLLVEVRPGIPTAAIFLLVLINLVPVAGVVTFAKGFRKLAGSMIIVPLGVALVIGSYTHFLSSGADNVLRMPPSALTLPYQVSAVLLTFLEALGCWIAWRMFA
jgi:hypothetical protein